MKHAQQRQPILEAMGYSTYSNYLQGKLWHRIRARVLKQNDGQCAVCGDRASEVHHIDYAEDTLRGKRLDGLLAICNQCHGIAEFDENGKKRSLAAANETLGLICHRQIETKGKPGCIRCLACWRKVRVDRAENEMCPRCIRANAKPFAVLGSSYAG